MHQEQITELFTQLEQLEPENALRIIAANYGSNAVFSTSFSEEDQIICHIIFSNNLPIEVFTLDTGRLFAETYSTWAATINKYGKSIKTYYPDAETIEQYINTNGPNAFYDSPDLRKMCCHIRKVEPLKRAIKDKSIWITGIRSAHSSNRTQMKQSEWDLNNSIHKFHPLLNWSSQQVDNYIQSNNIPVNPLHAKGFVSIGCAPCTRAIKPGEDFRAGRWWWEDENKKECGLHLSK